MTCVMWLLWQQCQIYLGHGSDLVIMSTVCWGLRQSTTLSRPSFTRSWTQCHHKSICLVHLWNWGFIVIDIDLSLSSSRRTGSFWINPSSPYRWWSYIASCTASKIATYSASVVDKAIVVCFFDIQVIAPILDRKTYLDINFQSSVFVKAASENP